MRDPLLSILAKSASPEAMSWLNDTLSAMSEKFEPRPFYYAFSGVSRHFSKTAKPATDPLLEPAGPPHTQWDEFRLARVVLLLELANQNPSTFLETFLAILNTADIREQVALFSALPWLPHPEALIESAVDGLRTNIVDIFDAIALDNDFPQKHFTDEAWNQMVLKAIFINRPLHRIVGVADRNTASLAEAISDLAHERWAAGRTITPEAWQCCRGFLDGDLLGDLKNLVTRNDEGDHAAVALLLDSADDTLLPDLRSQLTTEFAQIKKGSLTWQALGITLDDSVIR